MAEKIRALTYSKHPRHLHDIWHLHGQGVKINPDMVRAKVSYPQLKHMGFLLP